MESKSETCPRQLSNLITRTAEKVKHFFFFLEYPRRDTKFHLAQNILQNSPATIPRFFVVSNSGERFQNLRLHADWYSQCWHTQPRLASYAQPGNQ